MVVASLASMLGDDETQAREKVMQTYFTIDNRACKQILLNAMSESVKGGSVKAVLSSEVDKVLEVCGG